MAKWTSNTALSNANDAAFQAWIQEFDAGLLAVGLTHSADTGQLNLATATIPSANSYAGYVIYELFGGDLFLKVRFGADSPTTAYRIAISVGSGTDGAGTLTGDVISENFAEGDGSASVYNSYMCYDPDYVLAIVFKNGMFTSGSALTMVLARTVDVAGAPTTEGAYLFARGGSGTNLGSTSSSTGPGLSRIIFGDGATRSITGTDRVAICPPFDTSATDGGEGLGNFYVYPHYVGMPRLTPVIGCLCYLSSEIATNSTFVTDIFGVSRTFVATSTDKASALNTDSHRLAVLYED